MVEAIRTNPWRRRVAEVRSPEVAVRSHEEEEEVRAGDDDEQQQHDDDDIRTEEAEDLLRNSLDRGVYDS